MTTRYDKIEKLYEYLVSLKFGASENLKPLLHDLLSGVPEPETATEVMIRSQSGEDFLQRQMDRAMMDERRRCLGIVRSIDPHNEAEAHLIETIVRRIRGDE